MMSKKRAAKSVLRKKIESKLKKIKWFQPLMFLMIMKTNYDNE